MKTTMSKDGHKRTEMLIRHRVGIHELGLAVWEAAHDDQHRTGCSWSTALQRVSRTSAEATVRDLLYRMGENLWMINDNIDQDRGDQAAARAQELFPEFD